MKIGRVTGFPGALERDPTRCDCYGTGAKRTQLVRKQALQAARTARKECLRRV